MSTVNLTSPNNLFVRYASFNSEPAEVEIRLNASSAWRYWGTYFDRPTARRSVKALASKIGRKAVVTHRPDGTPCAKIFVQDGSYIRL